jgi:hypothetical protein
MKHQRWWCSVIYRNGCPACKVRQLRYGYRLSTGYELEIERILRGSLFTSTEKRWIMQQVGWR